MSAHALLSPSSASRWLTCTPSARLEERFPDNSGEAAKEGSLAHELGEALIKLYAKQIKKVEFNRIVKVIEANPLYSSDMLDHMEAYATFVTERYAVARKRTKDAVLQVETRLDLTEYAPESFGTGDVIIIADGTMDVIDLKYGKGVRVSAVENNQMMMYGLGALSLFELSYDIRTVRMTIYQPRLDSVSEYEMSADDLRHWGENVLGPGAEMAFKGEGEFVSGDHCRFCRAKSQCKARANENLKLARYEFAEGPLLSDDEISDILSGAPRFKNWLNDVEDYALKEAVNNGRVWPGFKLVEGRSVRTYADQDKVVEALRKAGIEDAVIYERSLLGITAMERAISKTRFNEVLGDLVIKSQGKLTLAPLSDKRQAYNSLESAINDFKNEPIKD